MDRLWNNVLKPNMLYGKEILIYDKEWLRKLESVQHQIGCKILGVNRSVNRAGVKLELEWKTIEREIMVAKLKFLGRIERMEDHRWAKKILQDIII